MFTESGINQGSFYINILNWKTENCAALEGHAAQFPTASDANGFRRDWGGYQQRRKPHIFDK